MDFSSILRNCSKQPNVVYNKCHGGSQKLLPLSPGNRCECPLTLSDPNLLTPVHLSRHGRASPGLGYRVASPGPVCSPPRHSQLPRCNPASRPTCQPVQGPRWSSCQPGSGGMRPYAHACHPNIMPIIWPLLMNMPSLTHPCGEGWMPRGVCLFKHPRSRSS